MRSVIYVLVVTFGLCAGASSGKEITLKHSLFGGWKYSVGGAKYQKVGLTGAGLAGEMEGNEPALAEMKRYKVDEIVATVVGWPGGFLVGWPLGWAIAEGEWKEEYETMLFIGIPLLFVSTIYEVSAVAHLKRAVRLSNGEEKVLDLGFQVRPPRTGRGGCFSVRVAWRF
jgi:hypothetical protein